MSTATATKPAPSPAFQSSGPTEPPQPPRRPVRPLASSQIGLREHQIRDFVCTLQPTQTLEDCYDPQFFSNVANMFSVSSIVMVVDAAGTFFAEFLVRAVATGNVVRGVKGGVKLALLRHISFDPVSADVMPRAFEVKYGGPADRWLVLKTADGSVVSRFHDTKELAERHMATLAMPLA
jgi:hypothetical protein